MAPNSPNLVKKTLTYSLRSLNKPQGGQQKVPQTYSKTTKRQGKNPKQNKNLLRLEQKNILRLAAVELQLIMYWGQQD